MQHSTEPQRVGTVLTTQSFGGLARWLHTVPPGWAHTGVWGQRTKSGPRRMLEETVLAEVRTRDEPTGAMDRDTVKGPWVYTGTQTRGLGKAGSVGKRDKGKTPTLQVKICRRNQKIRKPTVPIPKATVDSRKDSLLNGDWKDSGQCPWGWRPSIWNYHPHTLPHYRPCPWVWRNTRDASSPRWYSVPKMWDNKEYFSEENTLTLVGGRKEGR